MAAHPRAERIGWSQAWICVRDAGQSDVAAGGEPRYTIVHLSDDTDVEEYAEDRGFRSSRPLEPGWALLGPIPDLDREDEQWQ